MSDVARVSMGGTCCFCPSE